MHAATLAEYIKSVLPLLDRAQAELSGELGANIAAALEQGRKHIKAFNAPNRTIGKVKIEKVAHENEYQIKAWDNEDKRWEDADCFESSLDAAKDTAAAMMGHK